MKIAGKVDFKNYDNIHAVIEVFLEFLRRMPGRIVSREQFDNFKCVNGIWILLVELLFIYWTLDSYYWIWNY